MKNNYQKLKALYYKQFPNAIVPTFESWLEHPDIDIREVLRMMNKKQESLIAPDFDRYVLSIYGELQEFDTTENEFIQVLVAFNLSKPLKQQEEVCGELLKLIK